MKKSKMRRMVILTFILCTLFAGKTVAQEQVRALSLKEVEQVKRHYKADGKQDVMTYLFSDLKGVKKGEKVKVGILFEIKPGMNIYGSEKSPKNLPTVVEWKLPDGVKLERVVWQKTTSLKGGGKGYVGFCLVVAELFVASDFKDVVAEIQVTMSFQACDEQYCTPGETSNRLSLSVGKKEKSAVEKLFKER